MRYPSSLFLLTRAMLIALGAFVSSSMTPAGWSTGAAALAGALLTLCAIALESICSLAAPGRLAGAAAGALCGLALGLPLALLVGQTASGFPPLFAFTVPVYLGISLGASAAGRLKLAGAVESTTGQVAPAASLHILDTSVIIDGRIADIAETGFLVGTLVIPRFVLTELQQVADSADGLKRARGRRGLDILQRIQSSRRMPVLILDDDFDGIREVDRKLVEMAKARRATLVTNDFNLNKVASLEGVAVLNINELAGALRPIVLPGETMRVLIAKEGKENGQGVAYLDDGTMVVVDNGRRAISKTVEVTVTSVLQTTAGKMIFARFDEKAQSVWEPRETPGTVSTVAAR